MQDWDLYDTMGNRKYLTATEREGFLAAIPGALAREKRTFAMMLYYSGARITEALEVTCGRMDFERGGVVLRSLKKRGTLKYRFVPLPYPFLEKLDDVHHVKDLARKEPGRRLWSFNRKTGHTAIKAVMRAANIEGAQSTAHGLRHSFVIAHQQKKTPPQMIKEWAGWETTEMLEVYGRALGAEERELASQIW